MTGVKGQSAIGADPAINRAVGARLRDVRKASRRTLAAVESASGGRFKATVVGAYERGERTVSVPALIALCQFYGVNAAVLLAAVTGDDIGPDWPSIGGRCDVIFDATSGPLAGVA